MKVNDTESYIRQIDIKVLPHQAQRYDTCGDYFKIGSTEYITVSDMQNEKYFFLVALHEMIEAFYTRYDGIDEEDILKFDCEYEVERAQHLHLENDEPGDDPRAPYKKHHTFATQIEREMAERIHVNWNDYSAAVNSLPLTQTKIDYKPQPIVYTHDSKGA